MSAVEAMLLALLWLLVVGGLQLVHDWRTGCRRRALRIDWELHVDQAIEVSR